MSIANPSADTNQKKFPKSIQDIDLLGKKSSNHPIDRNPRMRISDVKYIPTPEAAALGDEAWRLARIDSKNFSDTFNKSDALHINSIKFLILAAERNASTFNKQRALASANKLAELMVLAANKAYCKSLIDDLLAS